MCLCPFVRSLQSSFRALEMAPPMCSPWIIFVRPCRPHVLKKAMSWGVDSWCGVDGGVGHAAFHGDKPPSNQTTTTKHVDDLQPTLTSHRHIRTDTESTPLNSYVHYAAVLVAHWVEVLPVAAGLQEHATAACDPRGEQDQACNQNHPWGQATYVANLRGTFGGGKS